MIKHSFKIGDKVKLKNSDFWDMGNPIGVVIVFDRCYIRVSWKGTKWEEGKSGTYPHLPKEIKHTVKVGEQLLFNFMKKE